MKPPVQYRPMTPSENEAAFCLACVRTNPYTFDRRFTTGIVSRWKSTTPTKPAQITENESAQLWRLFLKYRRQISHRNKANLLLTAEANAAEDLKRQSRMVQEQQQIQKMRDDENRRRSEEEQEPIDERQGTLL